MAGLYYYRQDAETNRDVVLGADFVDAFIGSLYGSGQFSPPNGPLPPPPALTNEQVSALLEFGPPLSKVFNRGEVRTRSYAAYFNGTWQMTDRLLRDFFGTVAKLPGMPRTYGLEAAWNFR